MVETPIGRGVRRAPTKLNQQRLSDACIHRGRDLLSQQSNSLSSSNIDRLRAVFFRSSRLIHEDVSQTHRHRRLGVSSLHRLRNTLADPGEAQDIESGPRTHCCVCGYRALVLFSLSKTNRARMPYRCWKCRAARIFADVDARSSRHATRCLRKGFRWRPRHFCSQSKPLFFA